MPLSDFNLCLNWVKVAQLKWFMQWSFQPWWPPPFPPSVYIFPELLFPQVCNIKDFTWAGYNQELPLEAIWWSLSALSTADCIGNHRGNLLESSISFTLFVFYGKGLTLIVYRYYITQNRGVSPKKYPFFDHFFHTAAGVPWILKNYFFTTASPGSSL